MAQRWTQDEDTHLLTHHTQGADCIASRDLGRPKGAGARRMEALTKSGARLQFARMMYAKAMFNHLAGREPESLEAELRRWESEENSALSAMAGK